MKENLLYKNFLTQQCLTEDDQAHDLEHIRRVVKTALLLAEKENADLEIVEAAAWLHDCVVLPKNHPDRKIASSMAAEKAVTFLKTQSFPGDKLEAVAHAIEAHSFSAGITPQTPEAKIVQDADRLDAVGAVGIARCFMVAGQLGRPFYEPDDPFCENREPNDLKWTIDHFYQKLLKLPDLVNTRSARDEALKRVEYMKNYLDTLREEI